MKYYFRWLSFGLIEEAFLTELLRAGSNPKETSVAEIFVYSGIQRKTAPALLKALEKPTRYTRVLLHLSDEKLRHDRGAYRKFDLVVRNYYDPRLLWRRNVVFIPLGWTESFGGEPDRGLSSRHYLWAFCGAVKGDRKKMVEIFAGVPEGWSYFSSGWNSSDQLASDEVRDLYANSHFVLCPGGNAHYDTFRVMEALQAGAVPVIVRFLGRDFMKYTFGEHPFLVADSWADAAVQVRALHEDRDQLRQRQIIVQTWYEKYRSSLESALSDLLSQPSPRNIRRYRALTISRLASLDLPLVLRVFFKFRKFRR